MKGYSCPFKPDDPAFICQEEAGCSGCYINPAIRWNDMLTDLNSFNALDQFEDNREANDE